MVLKSIRRLRTKCVLTSRSRLVSRRRMLSYRGLTMHVHCHDHPVPYQIGQLRSKQLFIGFLTRTSTVAPKRSTIFCSSHQIVNNTFVTSRQKVNLIVRRGGSFW